MKPLMIYYSKTGNTEKILSDPENLKCFDIIPANKVTAENLKDMAIVGLASGIYWVKHHGSLFSAAKKIPKTCSVLLITSSGFEARFLIKVYTFLMKTWLMILGLRLVGQWHCPGRDKSKDPLFSWLSLSEGRPNNNDLQEFNSFVKDMIERFGSVF